MVSKGDAGVMLCSTQGSGSRVEDLLIFHQLLAAGWNLSFTPVVGRVASSRRLLLLAVEVGINITSAVLGIFFDEMVKVRSAPEDHASPSYATRNQAASLGQVKELGLSFRL